MVAVEGTAHFGTPDLEHNVMTPGRGNQTNNYI